MSIFGNSNQLLTAIVNSKSSLVLMSFTTCNLYFKSRRDLTGVINIGCTGFKMQSQCTVLQGSYQVPPHKERAWTHSLHRYLNPWKVQVSWRIVSQWQHLLGGYHLNHLQQFSWNPVVSDHICKQFQNVIELALFVWANYFLVPTPNSISPSVEDSSMKLLSKLWQCMPSPLGFEGCRRKTACFWGALSSNSDQRCWLLTTLAFLNSNGSVLVGVGWTQAELEPSKHHYYYTKLPWGVFQDRLHER